MSKVWKIGAILLVVLCIALSSLTACTPDKTTTATTPPTTAPTTTPPSTTPTATTPPPAPVAKYVFLFIGDGYSIATRNATEVYMAATTGQELGGYKLTQSLLPSQGLTTTYSLNSVITDSAAAATALATGNKTDNGVLSMDSSGTVSYQSVATYARDAGMKVGIVTTTSIDHATPAAFYAHAAGRSDYYGIALDMVSAGFDYYSGGPPTTLDGDSGNIYDLAAAAGYTIADTPAEFAALAPGDGKVMAFNSVLNLGELGVNSLPYEIDRASDDISLAQYTAKAIELLDNYNGFFIMVEGGKIDWASHANDAASAIYEVLAFDAAIDEAVAFYNAHPDDTLVVVAADHECGGITNGFAATGYDSYYDILQSQGLSYWDFGLDLAALLADQPDATLDDLYPLIQQSFGLEAGTESDMAFSDNDIVLLETALAYQKMGFGRFGDPECIANFYYYDPITVVCTHVLNNKAGIGWTSFSHTGGPTPIAAVGVLSELFEGLFDNTEVFTKVMTAAGLH